MAWTSVTQHSYNLSGYVWPIVGDYILTHHLYYGYRNDNNFVRLGEFRLAYQDESSKIHIVFVDGIENVVNTIQGVINSHGECCFKSSSSQYILGINEIEEISYDSFKLIYGIASYYDGYFLLGATESTIIPGDKLLIYDIYKSNNINTPYISLGTGEPSITSPLRVNSEDYTRLYRSSTDSDAIYAASFSKYSSNETYEYRASLFGIMLVMLASPVVDLSGYSITIASSEYGTAESSVIRAKKDDTVTITLTPDSGYEVDKENTTIGSTVAVAPQWDSDTQFHFTMPAANVTINPAFKEEQTIYKNSLTIVGDGTANLGPIDAEIGATVTVNVNPAKGWHINKGATTLTSSVIVTPVWNSTDTQFTYTMPKANVTCTVTFTEDVKWNISVGESEHGTAATVPADSCYAGATVIVSFAPQTGYLVDRTLTSVMAGSTRVDLTWTGTNSAAFTAPDLEGVSGGIVVYPRFKEGDPYQPGGTSGAGGGGGTFSDASDPIPPSQLPQVTVTNSGLVTLFRPDASQVASLGRYLWTHLSDFIENLQKMFSNPMDTFVAFNIIPCTPAVGIERKVQLGLWETDIKMPPVVSQWYEFDFGNIFVAPYTGTFLDYAPNTKISMMLPYIGAVQLNTDEVMGQNISLRYRIDLLSGQCVALVMVNGDVYYQFTGECATAIPLTGSDWSRVYSAAVSAVGVAITGGVAAAGAGKAAAAFTGAQLVGSVSKATNAVAQAGNAFANVPKGVHGAPAMRQALVTASNQANDAIKDAGTLSTSVSNGVRASSIARTVNNFVGDVMGAKAAVQHTGTMTGSAGMLGVRDAYLIIEYPNQSLPDNLKHYVGYPLNATRKLGDMRGYTVCEQVYPAQCPCLDTEYAEILDALKAGVYL